jgi:multidrug efflux pump subunit AcrB
VFLQKMDAESIICSIEMPVGSPVERTEDRLMKIEQAIQELPEHEVDTIWTLVGGRLDVGERGATPNNKSHLGQIIIELATVEERDRTSEQVIADLRAKTSSISGINAIKYQTVQGGPSGAEIELEVTGNRMEDLIAAANALKSDLATFTGVYDIDDDFEAGRRELQIELLDSARPLNLTTQMLATEVRGAFYGLEARTLQRPKEDVDIRVRFPEADRTRIHTLESMRIRTPGGRMVPLSEVARVTEGRGYTSLKRVNQKRAVVITADVDQSEANSEEILAALRGPVDQIMHDYPSVTIEFAGNKRETTKSLSSLRRDFLIAILVIFVMLAGLFKSYVQPLIVLTAIPFGLIGAVGGHYVMGYPMTILSVIGTVALTGIVVNDALILVSFVNKEIASGQSIFEAVIAGGKRRLRPILLTSLTTILGLAPLMAEQSFQARFLIPMAISISFGLAFATILTLIVVPAIYLIVEDARWLARWAWYGPSDSEDPIGDPIARFLGRSRPVTRQDRD